MILRPYLPADCPELARLFYDTVHAVNARDYSPAQLDAWADGRGNLAKWDQSFREHITLVAEEGGIILGFADMAPDGYLDRLYVHKNHQGQGVATALLDRLEPLCPGTIVTHASITAKPFFEKRGYITVRSQQVERHGILLTNFIMQKTK